VTLVRRMAVIEISLTPTQRVLAWLDEAHPFGTLGAYVDSLLDQPSDAFPINRLARKAAMATRTALRNKPPEVVDAAVRKTLRETIFRFELVMRINVTAHETIDREGLLYLIFAGQLAMHATEDRGERRGDNDYLRRLATCRDLCFDRVDHMLAEEEACSTVQTRYLNGRAALFPETAAAWARRLRESQELAVMADRLCELDGVAPIVPPDPETTAQRVMTHVADMVEPARSGTLDKLDEGRQALMIATNWLRSKATKAEAAN
jgi:hypothetical protein